MDPAEHAEAISYLYAIIWHRKSFAHLKNPEVQMDMVPMADIDAKVIRLPL